ncbi:MAG: MarR family transcriptional regulator [Leptospiraceae bacterium]|nr:MarR family transcriptional regulator [Leptospiraceae bacterium]
MLKANLKFMSKADFRFKSENDSTGFLLWQVTNLWQREIRKSLTKYDLTHSQFVLLASILWFRNQEFEINQITLSNHTKMDPMNTSMVLRTLEKKGLVERVQHNKDTRAKTIDLTLKGKKIAKQSLETVEKFDELFFHPIGNETSFFNKKLISLLSRTE